MVCCLAVLPTQHFRVGIYHENSIGGAKSAEPLRNADFALGNWTAAGATTYAQLHQCTADTERVPCGGDEGEDVGAHIGFLTHVGIGSRVCV